MGPFLGLSFAPFLVRFDFDLDLLFDFVFDSLVAFELLDTEPFSRTSDGELLPLLTALMWHSRLDALEVSPLLLRESVPMSGMTM